VSKHWAFFERFEVPDYDDPELLYLTRWRLVQTPWFGVYLHRLGGPDPRATLHDHPWNFVSIVLWGGYTERVCQGRSHDGSPQTNWRDVRWINVKPALGLHSIRRLFRAPTWTLMLVGRRQRTWGYLDDDGTWTPFDEHPHNAEFERAVAARQARGT
jgi:hypothetical protein